MKKLNNQFFKNLWLPLLVVLAVVWLLYLYQKSSLVYGEFMRICSFATSKKADYDMCFRPYWDQLAWLTSFLKAVGFMLTLDFLIVVVQKFKSS